VVASAVFRTHRNDKQLKKTAALVENSKYLRHKCPRMSKNRQLKKHSKQTCGEQRNIDDS
jgi:hypothetical protein